MGEVGRGRCQQCSPVHETVVDILLLAVEPGTVWHRRDLIVLLDVDNNEDDGNVGY